MAVAVQVGVEDDSLFGDLANLGEAPDLETSRIGQNRPRPVHEFVEAAHLADQFMAWPQVEMIGIRENDFGVEIFLDLPRHQAFNRRLGTDGHKYRGFDDAVGGMEQSGPRAGLGTLSLEFEPQTFFKFTHCLQY